MFFAGAKSVTQEPKFDPRFHAPGSVLASLQSSASPGPQTQRVSRVGRSGSGCAPSSGKRRFDASAAGNPTPEKRSLSGSFDNIDPPMVITSPNGSREGGIVPQASKS